MSTNQSRIKTKMFLLSFIAIQMNLARFKWKSNIKRIFKCFFTLLLNCYYTIIQFPQLLIKSSIENLQKFKNQYHKLSYLCLSSQQSKQRTNRRNCLTSTNAVCVEMINCKNSNQKNYPNYHKELSILVKGIELIYLLLCQINHFNINLEINP